VKINQSIIQFIQRRGTMFLMRKSIKKRAKPVSLMFEQNSD